MLEQLFVAAGPLTHRQLVEASRAAGFDQATLYRNLQAMWTAGLVSRTNLGGVGWIYELCRGSEAGQRHPHLVCMDCGAVHCPPGVRFSLHADVEGALRAVGRVHEVVVNGQ